MKFLPIVAVKIYHERYNTTVLYFLVCFATIKLHLIVYSRDRANISKRINSALIFKHILIM